MININLGYCLEVKYNKTYAATVMSESVWLLLAIAAAENLELEFAYVNSHMLYGAIELQLNPDIINYNNKIREIAIKIY